MAGSPLPHGSKPPEPARVLHVCTACTIALSAYSDEDTNGCIRCGGEMLIVDSLQAASAGETDQRTWTIWKPNEPSAWRVQAMEYGALEELPPGAVTVEVVPKAVLDLMDRAHTSAMDTADRLAGRLDQTADALDRALSERDEALEQKAAFASAAVEQQYRAETAERELGEAREALKGVRDELSHGVTANWDYIDKRFDSVLRAAGSEEENCG